MSLGLGLGLGLARQRRKTNKYPISAKDSGGKTIKPIMQNGYLYWVFTSGGDVSVKKPTEIEYLLIGSGGSGGMLSYGRKGGGGAGDVVASGHQSNLPLSLSSGSYIIAIDADGGDTRGGSTTIYDSKMTEIKKAIGGGRGGHNGAINGLNGGSGGGGGNHADMGNGGLAEGIGYGNNGGSCERNIQRGGGGGGAGGVGQTATSTQQGNGGIGLSFADIWTGVTGSDLGLPFNRFGGGGAATQYSISANAVDGGGTYGDNKDGITNTGGGGGGNGYSTTPNGLGGLGLAIIRIAI